MCHSLACIVEQHGRQLYSVDELAALAEERDDSLLHLFTQKEHILVQERQQCLQLQVDFLLELRFMATCF